MHIETVGSGPALILIHGWAMHGGVFAPLIERLRGRHTLYLVDLPGHGRSGERDGAWQLRACADAIASRTPPAPWLGWSLGGLVALTGALWHAQHVTALAMLCATPRFVIAEDWPHGVAATVFRQFAADLAGDYRGTLDRFLALEAHGAEHARTELRQLREAVFAHGEPAPAALRTGLRLLEETDLRAGLASVSIPSLWIAGRRDRLVDWRAMQAAAALAPESEFLRIDGAGHAPFLGAADQVAEALAKLVERG